jgi:hypothetical protein
VRYRRPSNVGAIIIIVLLLLAMIPLSVLVWKVIEKQFPEVDPAAAEINTVDT